MHAVLYCTGEAPAINKWSLGNTWLSIQSWNQAGRRELWCSLQRCTCNRYLNTTSTEAHGQNDTGREIPLHSGHQTSQRCACWVLGYWMAVALNVPLPLNAFPLHDTMMLMFYTHVCMHLQTYSHTHTYTHKHAHTHTHTLMQQDVQQNERWRTS